MILLNLESKNKEEEKVKTYLQNNASEILAYKINNGVIITKDNKQVRNKKTLTGFMNYACNLAREQSEKGATSACIDDETVYGWAIHYFEEDTIEGTLYNLDNTPYKPLTPTYTQSKVEIPKVNKPNNQQGNLFDLMDNNSKEKTTEADTDEVSEEDIEEAQQELEQEETHTIPPKKQGTPIYQKYMELQNKYPDGIIALRLGDFYEVFGNNAKILSKELDLTLTGRDCGLDERVPMIGFPFHCSDMFFSKIVEKGHKIVIVDDLQEQIKQPIFQENIVINKETGEVFEKANNDLVNQLREILGDFEVAL